MYSADGDERRLGRHRMNEELELRREHDSPRRLDRRGYVGCLRDQIAREGAGGMGRVAEDELSPRPGLRSADDRDLGDPQVPLNACPNRLERLEVDRLDEDIDTAAAGQTHGPGIIVARVEVDDLRDTARNGGSRLLENGRLHAAAADRPADGAARKIGELGALLARRRSEGLQHRRDRDVPAASGEPSRHVLRYLSHNRPI